VMDRTERKALDVLEGGIELLRNAILKGDDPRELEFRARDLLADVRAIRNGKAKTISQFPKPAASEPTPGRRKA
jgi:hypothetical protein